MCAMTLVHSRLQRVVFCTKPPQLEWKTSNAPLSVCPGAVCDAAGAPAAVAKAISTVPALASDSLSLNLIVQEPCAMCAMTLVHSRLRRVVFCRPDPAAGAIASRYRLHGQRSLNHKCVLAGSLWDIVHWGDAYLQMMFGLFVVSAENQYNPSQKEPSFALILQVPGVPAAAGGGCRRGQCSAKWSADGCRQRRQILSAKHPIRITADRDENGRCKQLHPNWGRC